MRIVNVVVYLFLLGCVVISRVSFKEETIAWQKWKQFVKVHLYLVGLLLAVNTISFAMTYASRDTSIYVEKAGYGEEEKEIPFLLRKGEEQEEISLVVSPRQLTGQELQERVSEAFAYLEENMKGENESLLKINNELDCSLDRERFPFDVEFQSEDNGVVTSDGMVKNDREYLLSLGYLEQEIEQGIPIAITVMLWYGEESFQQTFSLRVFQRQRSELEKVFAGVQEKLEEIEEKASHEEGFRVATQINGVDIMRTDQSDVTPEQVLLAGVILVVLMLLREQENKRRKQEYRKDCLRRSYPWFVNELVLLLGAGMQVRNILAMLARESECIEKKEDYRKPLIEELKVANKAMELGMSEEQAYYRLGRRLGIPCYIKIMTLLEQNVKRGGKGLIASLEQEEIQALEERKNLAKRYGEEAGTKLLGPMMLLLLIIMFMIMVPAFMGFA